MAAGKPDTPPQPPFSLSPALGLRHIWGRPSRAPGELGPVLDDCGLGQGLPMETSAPTSFPADARGQEGAGGRAAAATQVLRRRDGGPAPQAARTPAQGPLGRSGDARAQCGLASGEVSARLAGCATGKAMAQHPARGGHPARLRGEQAAAAHTGPATSPTRSPGPSSSPVPL